MPGGIGSEARRVLRLSAGRDSEQRTAVERVQRRDHADLLLAEAVVRVTARELERGLVRLGARVAEEHALGERVVDEAARETQRRLVGEPVRHVPDRAWPGRSARVPSPDGNARARSPRRRRRSRCTSARPGPTRASLRRAPGRTTRARSSAPSARRTSRARPAASTAVDGAGRVVAPRGGGDDGLRRTACSSCSAPGRPQAASAVATTWISTL